MSTFLAIVPNRRDSQSKRQLCPSRNAVPRNKVRLCRALVRPNANGRKDGSIGAEREILAARTGCRHGRSSRSVSATTENCGRGTTFARESRRKMFDGQSVPNSRWVDGHSWLPDRTPPVIALPCRAAQLIDSNAPFQVNRQWTGTVGSAELAAVRSSRTQAGSQRGNRRNKPPLPDRNASPGSMGCSVRMSSVSAPPANSNSHCGSQFCRR